MKLALASSLINSVIYQEDLGMVRIVIFILTSRDHTRNFSTLGPKLGILSPPHLEPVNPSTNLKTATNLSSYLHWWKILPTRLIIHMINFILSLVKHSTSMYQILQAISIIYNTRGEQVWELDLRLVSFTSYSSRSAT